jgi:AcrR family transcriptional regulator
LTVEITNRRGRPSREEAERRHQHLLDVAAAIFIEQGYNAASIEGIAQAAGIWKQAIYQRYGDKYALFSAVVKRLAELQPERFPDDDDLPLEAGLRLRISFMLSAFLEPEGQAIYKLFMRDSHRFPELVGIIDATANSSFREPLYQYLKRKRQLGLIRPINVATVTTTCTDLVYGCMMRFSAVDNLRVDAKDIKKAAQQMVELLINGLAPTDQQS